VGNFFFCDKGLASLFTDTLAVKLSNNNGLQNDVKVSCEEFGAEMWITARPLRDG